MFCKLTTKQGDSSQKCLGKALLSTCIYRILFYIFRTYLSGFSFKKYLIAISLNKVSQMSSHHLYFTIQLRAFIWMFKRLFKIIKISL